MQVVKILWLLFSSSFLKIIIIMITELTRTETGWQQTRINRRSLVKRWGEYEEGEQENKKEEEKPNIFYFLFITHTHTQKRPRIQMVSNLFILRRCSSDNLLQKKKNLDHQLDYLFLFLNTQESAIKRKRKNTQ